MKNYPNLSASLKKKADHRRLLKSLPFEKKIDLVFTLQKRRRFVKSGQLVSKQIRKG